MGFWDSLVDTIKGAGEGIADIFSSGEKETSMTTPIEKLNLLGEMIRQHDLHFGRLAAEAPTDLLVTFKTSRWDPFLRAWATQSGRVLGTTPEAMDALASTSARALSELRELARANYIDVPDLDAIARSTQAQPAVAGDLTVRHDRAGRVIIEHEIGGCAGVPGISVGHRFGGGRGWSGGGGAWRGPRSYDMGWRGGWGYPYPVAYEAVPPGCYVDAYGQIVCPYMAPAPANDEQAAAAVSGWFDSIKDAALTVTGTKWTNQFIHDNHLEPLVKTAAMAVATAYGGPAAGAAAGALSGPVMAMGVQDKSKSAQAQAAPQQVATAIQQHGPQAVAVAKQAIDKVSAAYHAADIAQAAANGDPDAKAKVASLVQQAAAGHGGASDLVGILGQLAQSYGYGGGDAGTVRDPNWQVDPNAIQMDDTTVSGAAPANPAAQARAAAAQAPGNVVGVVLRTDGSWALQPFASSDDADDWYGQWLGVPHAYIYVGYFDKAYGGGAQNEQISPHYLAQLQHAQTQGHAAVSGVLAPLLAAGAGFAAGYWGPRGVRWAQGKWDAHKAHT